MRLDQITIKNIKSFLEGSFKFYLYKLIKSPDYIMEQYLYRLSLCKKDCIPNKKCVYCGCPPIKKAFVKQSCNKGKRFPDLLTENQWKVFKKENNINVEEDEE
tara:strand:+ start:1558 stop:1866 length:309 start_codon:yes stop_codon:yes gene_type:complete